jgi:hypothetical protein
METSLIESHTREAHFRFGCQDPVIQGERSQSVNRSQKRNQESNITKIVMSSACISGWMKYFLPSSLCISGESI